MTLKEIFEMIERTKRENWHHYQNTYTLLSNAAIAIHFSLMDEDVPDLEEYERERFNQCGGYAGTTSFKVTYYGQEVTGSTVVIVGEAGDYNVIPFPFEYPGFLNEDDPVNVSRLEAHISWLMSSDIDKDAYNGLLWHANVHVEPDFNSTFIIEK